jgi:hypothetical protein
MKKEANKNKKREKRIKQNKQKKEQNFTSSSFA